MRKILILFFFIALISCGAEDITTKTGDEPRPDVEKTESLPTEEVEATTEPEPTEIIEESEAIATATQAPTSQEQEGGEEIMSDSSGEENLQCFENEEGQICAWVSNLTPNGDAIETIYGSLYVGGVGQAGYTMNTTWHYESGDSYCNLGVTDDSGAASCWLGEDYSTEGRRVDVDVEINGWQVTTWFGESQEVVVTENEEGTETEGASESALSFADIRVANETMTEAQFNQYTADLEGKSVENWTGWVTEVNEGLLGGYEVWIDMDNPDTLSVQDVQFDISEEVALQLQLKEQVVFSGKIKRVSDIFETTSITLEDGVIHDLDEATGSDESTEAEGDPDSPLLFADIRAANETMTEAQFNQYTADLEGKSVENWTGWVTEVNEGLLGGYEVWIDMDNPDTLSVQDVQFDISEEVALQLKLKQQVTFSGKIKRVSDIFETTSITLEDGVIHDLDEATGSNESTEAEGEGEGEGDPDSPLLFADIRVANETMTEAQFNQYTAELEGRSVESWTGWVTEVNEGFFGGYEVLIDMDNPDSLSVSDVRFDVSEEVALQLQLKQQVTFSGKVKRVSDIFETTNITLEDGVIHDLDSAEGAEEQGNETYASGGLGQDRATWETEYGEGSKDLIFWIYDGGDQQYSLTFSDERIDHIDIQRSTSVAWDVAEGEVSGFVPADGVFIETFTSEGGRTVELYQSDSLAGRFSEEFSKWKESNLFMISYLVIDGEVHNTLIAVPTVTDLIGSSYESN